MASQMRKPWERVATARSLMLYYLTKELPMEDDAAQLSPGRVGKMKKALILVAFVAALTVAGMIPTRASFGLAPLPAMLQAEPQNVSSLPATVALAALAAANNNTYALATEALADSTITTIALGPNQPASASGNVAPMTVAERQTVARTTFD